MGLAADTTVAGPVCSIARLQARIGSYFCADPKLEQAAAGNSNLPALAGVVGFKARVIMLADVET